MGEFGTRAWQVADVPFLWDMLYESLHVPVGGSAFPRSVLDEPGIAHYLEGFGERVGDDAHIVVDAAGHRIGAAWCRRFGADDPGYGYVADDVPELGMAVVAERRGEGIGRVLLERLLERNPAMSLSVDNENTGAAALYRSVGFVPVHSNDGSTTMARDG